MRRRTLAIALALAATVYVSAAEQPNIVLIVADDLGFGDLGPYGGRIATPNIDRLAREGRRFTHAYAPASTCTPSRYSILTGDYPWRQQQRKTSILDGDAPLVFAPGQPTLPAVLRDSGYATALIGKWHLGLGDGEHPVDFNGEICPGPLEVGFASAFFIPATADRVPTVFIEGRRVMAADPADPIRVSYLKEVTSDPTGADRPDLLKQRADAQHSGTIVNGISRIGSMAGGHAARWRDENMSDLITQRAIRYIDEQRAAPFFLYFGAFEPHVPRVPHPRFQGATKFGPRGDVIVQFDAQVGELLAAIDRAGIAERTLVVITSDNGPVLFDGYYDRADELTGDHQPAGGLRGWKYLVYEGGTRVPFLVRWPGHVSMGVDDRMICLTDLLATFAALGGANVPAGAGVDSCDQSTILIGRSGAPVRTEVVEQGISGAIALKSGDWKFIPTNRDQTLSGAGSGTDPSDKRWAEAIVPMDALFDLKNDPAEKENLAGARPEQVAQLRRRLEEIRRAR